MKSVRGGGALKVAVITSSQVISYRFPALTSRHFFFHFYLGYYNTSKSCLLIDFCSRLYQDGPEFDAAYDCERAALAERLLQVTQGSPGYVSPEPRPSPSVIKGSVHILLPLSCLHGWLFFIIVE
jgi:hypothetical protein